MNTENISLYKSPEGYQEVMAHYDRALQSMGVPYESQYVETRFGLTHALVCGNGTGRPVVLFHGMNANLTTWVNWIPALAPDYCIYALDVIGAMGKSAPSRPPKKGPAYGQWAADALAALGLERANMIGASNGGWIVGKLGPVAPERVTSAVLMSSAGFAPLNMKTTLQMIPRMVFKPPEEAARQLLTLISPPDLPPDPLTLELFELMIRHFRSEGNAPLLSDDEIRRLSAPTCMLMGQYEVTVDPYKAVVRALRLLPNVISAEIVPGVGHTLAHRQPDWVIGRVLTFLDKYAM